jgi:urease accessory protein
MYPSLSTPSMAPITPMRIEDHQLLLLLNWMSPAFPTGQFAYSHGLEWAIDENIVTDAGGLKSWTGDLLTRGSGWNDAVLFARCWDEDAEMLNELALALATSRERHLETTQLGRSFGMAANVFANCPHPPYGHLLPSCGREKAQQDYLPSPVAKPWENVPKTDEGFLAYPIAAGAACVAFGIPKREALLAFLQGFSAALTSVAVRLVPIGQTAGLEVLRDLMPMISETAARAAAATLEDLGAITILADIASMKHETQSSRVFRT